jgi:hypothetical protein
MRSIRCNPAANVSTSRKGQADCSLGCSGSQIRIEDLCVLAATRSLHGFESARRHDGRGRGQFFSNLFFFTNFSARENECQRRPTRVRSLDGSQPRATFAPRSSIRLEFSGAPNAREQTLESIRWEEWCDEFDKKNLALVYEETFRARRKEQLQQIVSREREDENPCNVAKIDSYSA